MGRGEPTYDLRHLQQLIGQGTVSSWTTITAERGAVDLGLQRNDIIEAVLELLPQHFYKSMESGQCPGLWQDVYHLDRNGVALYIKLQLSADGRAVVVQFKRR